MTLSAAATHRRTDIDVITPYGSAWMHAYSTVNAATLSADLADELAALDCDLQLDDLTNSILNSNRHMHSADLAREQIYRQARVRLSQQQLQNRERYLKMLRSRPNQHVFEVRPHSQPGRQGPPAATHRPIKGRTRHRQGQRHHPESQHLRDKGTTTVERRLGQSLPIPFRTSVLRRGAMTPHLAHAQQRQSLSGSDCTCAGPFSPTVRQLSYCEAAPVPYGVSLLPGLAIRRIWRSVATAATLLPAVAPDRIRRISSALHH